MHEFCVEYLRCVRCRGRLELEALVEGPDITEGFLHCYRCHLDFPVVDGVPILWDDFAGYVRCRASLGGQMYLKCGHRRVREYVRSCLSVAEPTAEDISRQELRWARIYQNSSRSRFYTEIRRRLDMLEYDTFLGHGCSIGLVSGHAAERASTGFGIDRSFHAVRHARMSPGHGHDYLVADSLEHPFGEQRFDLVMALNLLEIVEPTELLRVMTPQTGRLMMVSDPYDYERADRSVKGAVNGAQFRDMIRRSGFSPVSGTSQAGYIPWSLAINDRARLNYRVDLVIAERRHG